MRSQGTIEYILLLMGLVLVTLLVIDALIEMSKNTAREVTQSVNYAYEKIKKLIYEAEL